VRIAVVRALNGVLADDAGNALAEYALLAAILGIAMIAGVGAMQVAGGTELNTTAAGWQNLAQSPP
jgi:Flp pilus assembly pilin Flp